MAPSLPCFSRSSLFRKEGGVIAAHHSMIGRTLLPGGAQPIAWLQNTGLEYIDTGIAPHANLVFRCEFTMLSSDGSWVIGSHPWSDSSDLRLFKHASASNMYHDRCGGRCQVSSLSPFTGWEDMHFAIECGNLYMMDIPTGTKVATGSTQSASFSSDKRMWVFNLYESSNGSKVPTVVRLNWAQFLLDGVLVRDFVPAQLGSVGVLFDFVSEEMFFNGGTGGFVCGPDIRLKRGEDHA